MNLIEKVRMVADMADEMTSAPLGEQSQTMIRFLTEKGEDGLELLGNIFDAMQTVVACQARGVPESRWTEQMREAKGAAIAFCQDKALGVIEDYIAGRGGAPFMSRMTQ